MKYNNLSLLILITCLSSCATSHQAVVPGDFYVTIYAPAKYMIGIPKQQITGNLAETSYKGTKIKSYSMIVGTYTNKDNNNCQIIWHRINLINGSTITDPRLAYTPCVVDEIYTSGKLVGGYWY